MLIGILSVLAGFFGGSFMGLFTEDLDYNMTPDDIGKNINTDMLVYYEEFDVPDKALQYIGDLSGDGAFIVLDFSGLSDKEERFYYSKYYQHVTIRGTLRALNEDEYNEVAQEQFRLYDHYYYEKNLPVTLDEFHDYLMESILPYCIDVQSVSSFNWIPFIPAGICIFLISLVLEICFIFKLKKRIVLPVVYGLMVIVPSVLLFNHIRTMLSVNKVADGFYTMRNLECTDTAGLLESGSVSANGFLDWVFKNHLYGLPNFINFDDSLFGCSAFAAVTPDGDHLFGRNFDLLETDTLLIYSHPEGAYESIGIADLGILGVGQTYPINPDSPLGKFVMVVTPYVIVDGMNEKGVGAGILTLNSVDMSQDKGNPDLAVFCAIRGILDTCASVDEALALLGSYDIYSDLGNYHLFITDRSGKYVVVEWLEGEMVVTEHPCCTNSIIAPGKYYDTGIPDSRKSTIEEALGDEHIVSAEEAMEILDKVKDIAAPTEWSCIYNLDDFTVSICLDGDFTTVYTFSAKDIK